MFSGDFNRRRDRLLVVPPDPADFEIVVSAACNSAGARAQVPLRDQRRN